MNLDENNNTERTTITAENLLRIIYNNDTISNNYIINNQLTIEKFYLNEEIKLLKAKLVWPMVIKNCVFEENFEIDETQFADLKIIDCVFTKSLKIRECFVKRNVKIINCIIKKELRFIKNNCQEKFIIDKSAIEQTLQAEDNNFTGIFELSDSYLRDMYFLKNTYTETLNIYACQVNNTINLNDCTLKKSLMSDKNNFYGTFTVTNSKIESQFTFSRTFINILIINELSQRILLYIYSSCRLNTLNFRETILKESIIKISGSIYSLKFQDVQNLGTLIFTGVRVPEDLHEAELIISSVRIDGDYPDGSELKIENSDLGKTTFIDCDFHQSNMHFVSSKITDVFITGTTMPREIITKSFHQQQLGYSQIKKIYEARGDKVESSRYFSREMNAYLQTLSWRKNTSEKLNVGLNKISTNHGQNWQQGLLSTLIVSFIFYVTYCLCLEMRIVPINQKSFEKFGEVSSYFLEFVNPIHKADYVAEKLLDKNKPISGWARFVEGFSRIFIAYFVYQLIQSFRKHGKSSS